MGVREKLVEIERAAEWFERRAENTPMPSGRKMFKLAGEALREKAHGVTVQEWISVKDRLPEVGKCVLTYCEANKNKYACGEYSDTYQGFFVNNFWNGDVTHWCYLPHLPKGGDVQ